jgi:hypothetical protein
MRHADGPHQRSLDRPSASAPRRCPRGDPGGAWHSTRDRRHLRLDRRGRLHRPVKLIRAFGGRTPSLAPVCGGYPAQGSCFLAASGVLVRCGFCSIAASRRQAATISSFFPHAHDKTGIRRGRRPVAFFRFCNKPSAEIRRHYIRYGIHRNRSFLDCTLHDVNL